MMTDEDAVRLLINDRDAALFDGDEILALLDLEAGNVKLAAAQGLDMIATSEALIGKRITSLDLSTDGPAVAKEVRAQAQALRRQSAEAKVEDEVNLAPEFVITGGYAAPELTGYLPGGFTGWTGQ